MGLFQSHNQSIIPLQALETLRFISDLDDIDFPSDLIGIDIKKETIIYPEELHANEYEIEDLKPCIADLDLKNTIKVRVSVQGVESLWGDCRFIPADWGS